MTISEQQKKLVEIFEIEKFWDDESNSAGKRNANLEEIKELSGINRLAECFYKNAEGQLESNPEFDFFSELKRDKPKRFKCVLGLALLQTIEDSKAKPDEIKGFPQDLCLTKFGCSDLGSYLQFLRKTKVLGEYDLKGIGTNGNKSAFHHFGLKFEALRSAVESVFNTDCKSVKLEIPPILEMFLGGRNDGDEFTTYLSEFERQPTEKFEDDVAAQIEVGNVSIYCAETIGRRSNNEDVYVIGASTNSDSREVPKKFQDFLHKSSEKIKIESQKNTALRNSGSTTIMANYCSDQVLTLASCGDARAVVFFVAPNDSVEWVRLTRDHNLEDFFELKLAMSNGGQVGEDQCGTRRVFLEGGGGLNMSRSIGDVVFGNTISNEADFFSYDIKAMIAQRSARIGAPVKAFVMITCDGFYEDVEEKRGGKTEVVSVNEKFYANGFTKWLKNDKNQQEEYQENVMKYFKDLAYALGIGDNLTGIIFDATESPTITIFVAVNDGHGGRKVAKFLGEEMVNNLVDKNREFVCSKDLAIVGCDYVYEVLPVPARSPQSSFQSVRLDGVREFSRSYI